MHQPDQAETAAKHFIAAHQGEHLSSDTDRLLHRCAGHLVDAFYLSSAHALRLARNAMDELAPPLPAHAG